LLKVVLGFDFGCAGRTTPSSVVLPERGLGCGLPTGRGPRVRRGRRGVRRACALLTPLLTPVGVFD